MGIAHDPQLSSVFKALGDDTRIQILEELRHRDDQSLFEICARLIESSDLTLSRQAISRHLSTLEQAGLIQTAWQGRTKIHSLSAGALESIVAPWLSPFSQGEQG
ncbi:MAG: metalloregulator ArsR/SmtB family transcription factor [Pseudomonadota bacterium]